MVHVFARQYLAEFSGKMEEPVGDDGGDSGHRCRKNI